MLKSLRDQVYGMVDVHPLCYKLLYLPEFQRLRDIKQLTNLFYVYPGATHDRYQHCIGVYHLAEVFVDRLQRVQPELNITEEEKLCVCIGGLLHDIGHITQGHLYPMYVSACNSKALVKHEIMSVYVFQYLIKKYHLKDLFSEFNLTEEHIHMICEIILGSDKDTPPKWKWSGCPGREFLIQIVANAKSGVDVDRFDYMLRDCLNLGLNCSYNYDRIVKCARCIKNEQGEFIICYNEKVIIDVYEMFQCRMSLYRRAYHHRTNRIIDIMLIEALRLAEEKGFGIQTTKGVVPLSAACTNLDAYIKATDYLVLMLKNSINEEYRPSRMLIQRIERREYYPFIGEVLINTKLFSILDMSCEYKKHPDINRIQHKIREDFNERAKEKGQSIQSDDLVIDVVNVSLGNGNTNPLQTVLFFKESDMDHMFTVPPSIISNTIPEECQDWLIRIYCKGGEEQTKQFCELFELWKEKLQNEATPDSNDEKGHQVKRRKTITFPTAIKRRFSCAELI